MSLRTWWSDRRRRFKFTGMAERGDGSLTPMFRILAPSWGTRCWGCGVWMVWPFAKGWGKRSWAYVAEGGRGAHMVEKPVHWRCGRAIEKSRDEAMRTGAFPLRVFRTP